MFLTFEKIPNLNGDHLLDLVPGQCYISVQKWNFFGFTRKPSRIFLEILFRLDVPN